MELSTEIWTMIIGFGLTIITVLLAVIGINGSGISRLRTGTSDSIDKLREEVREDIRKLRKSMEKNMRQLRKEIRQLRKNPNVAECSQEQGNGGAAAPPKNPENL